MATLLFSSNVFPLLAFIIGILFGFSGDFLFGCLCTIIGGDALCLFLIGLSDCSVKINNILEKLDDWCLGKFF